MTSERLKAKATDPEAIRQKVANRMAYCPKNGEPCNPEECCRMRREKSQADLEG